MNLYTLVTGASSGIGRATAIRLSKDRNLILHGRNEEALVKTRLLCDYSRKHEVWAFDLDNEIDSLDIEMSLEFARRGLSIESFVHCAGAMTVQPFRLSAATMPWLMNVNFFAAVEVLRVLMNSTVNAEHLRSAVFVSSIASQFGARGMTAYCASKGALDAFMRAAAVELAPRVRVNSVLPGACRTPMTEKVKMVTDQYPLGIGEADDVAQAIEYLLNSRWITGSSLVVDGGRTVDLSA